MQCNRIGRIGQIQCTLCLHRGCCPAHMAIPEMDRAPGPHPPPLCLCCLVRRVRHEGGSSDHAVLLFNPDDYEDPAPPAPPQPHRIGVSAWSHTS